MPFPNQNTYDPLVIMAIKQLVRTLPSEIQYADLLQSGSLALHIARLNYDKSKNDNFEAYAFQKIKWAMLDTIRQHYLFHHSRRPHVYSLDDEDANAPHLLDISTDSLELYISFIEVLKLFRHLPEREQQILLLSLDEDFSQRQLAKDWNITEARISQLKRQAIRRIQSFL